MKKLIEKIKELLKEKPETPFNPLQKEIEKEHKNFYNNFNGLI